MSRSRWIITGCVLVIAVALIGVFGLFGVRSFVQLVMPPISSPIIVRGGSIEGGVDWFHQWHSTGNSGSFRAVTWGNSNHLITLDGFTGGSVTLSGTQGWLIVISNTDANGNRKPNAVEICSEQTCKAASLGDQRTIYITPLSDLEGEASQLGRRLKFHDRSSGCNNGSGSYGEGPCDQVSAITVTTNAKAVPVNGVLETSGSFACVSSKKCKIIIGND